MAGVVARQLADVGNQLTAVRGDLAAANTRLAVIDVRTQTTAQASTDHEQRIRQLEAFRGKMLGAAITIGTVSGVASGLIGYVLGHLH
jgi:hypothetical protein